MARKRPTKRGDAAVIGLRQQQIAAVDRGSVSKIDVAKPAARTPERAEYNETQARLAAGKGAVRAVAQGAQARRRQAWEKANPERYTTAQESMSGARNLSNRQLSRSQGWDQEGGGGTDIHPRQGTLFEDPRQVDSPPRWEDLAPHQQKRVLARAADFGATPQSMKRAYTAQLQRGLMRDPEHLSFYEARGQNAAGTDLPRERMERSSREMETPFHLTAATNAITSPQMSFVTTTKSGHTYYPNAESAEAAINYSRAGMTGREYIRDFKGHYPHQGYPENLGRAIDVASKVESGTPLREAWNPGGRAGAGSGDKVRAYHNAWVDPKSPEGNYFVSDTHSGAAGMAPHLAGTAAESEYLKTAGIHALHDKIAREVHEEHGLSSTSRGQSLQWNQEKLEQTGVTHAGSSTMHGAASVESMQPAVPEKPRNVNQNQMGWDF